MIKSNGVVLQSEIIEFTYILNTSPIAKLYERLENIDPIDTILCHIKRSFI